MERAYELGIIVDPEDEWLLSVLTWTISTKGYVESDMYVDGWRKRVKFHHFITGTPIYEDEFIDHRNRNKLDNTRDNLRWTNEYLSSQNRGFVDEAPNMRIRSDGKFEVRITRNGVTHQIGTFSTEEEAINARDQVLRSGVFPYGNQGRPASTDI